MAESNSKFSDLSPEVEASIIKVAGDWSLAMANKELSNASLKDFFVKQDYYSKLIDYFTSAYNEIKDIVEG
jgi:hypothetical protein